MLNLWLKRIVFTGIFLVPFVPLVVTESLFFPYITGKAFVYRLIVEIIFSAWLILMIKNPVYRPRMSFILKAFAAFIFLIAVSDALSPNAFKSFWSNFERMEGWVALIHHLGYFLVIGSMLAGEKLWRRFFDTSIGVSLIVTGYGILQLFGVFTINQGGVRVDSTFGNAAYLGVYTLFHIFLAVFFLMRERLHSWRQYFYGAAIALNLIILYFTATRGVFIGLFVGVLVSVGLLALFERENKKLRKIFAGALIALFVFVGSIFLLKDTALIKATGPLNRIASISLNDANVRFNIWKIAFAGFKERPIFGWGQESFNYVFNKHYHPSLYGQEQWFDRTHNIVFDWLIAGGLLGLIAYLVLFAAGLIAVWKGEPPRFHWIKAAKIRGWLERIFGADNGGLGVREKAVLTGLLAGYFAQNFFVFDQIGSYILFASVLGYLHSRVAEPLPDRVHKALSLDRGALNRLVIPVVTLVFVFSVYFVNAKGFMTARTLIKGFQSYPNEGAEKNLTLFKKAASYEALGKSEVREQISQAASRVLATKEASLALKQSFFDAARSALMKQIEEAPGDARYYLFLGSFFNQAGAFEEARAYLGKALELSPRKQMIIFEIGSSYFAEGKTAEALAAFKEAFLLEPKFSEARQLYGLMAIYNRDLKLAEEILVPAYGTALVADDRFINAYDKIGDKKAVLKIWQNRVGILPDNADWRVSLAAAYLAAGERQNALKELEESARLNPDLKERVEYYIKEIRAGRNP